MGKKTKQSKWVWRCFTYLEAYLVVFSNCACQSQGMSHELFVDFHI